MTATDEQWSDPTSAPFYRLSYNDGTGPLTGFSDPAREDVRNFRSSRAPSPRPAPTPARVPAPAPEVEPDPAPGPVPARPVGRRSAPAPVRASVPRPRPVPAAPAPPTSYRAPGNYQTQPGYKNSPGYQTQPGYRPTPVAPRGARSRRRTAPGRKPNRAGIWVFVIVLAVVVAGNAGSALFGKLNHRDSVPSGAISVARSYYSDVGRYTPAANAHYVCPSHRPAWLAGQSAATSDSQRGITGVNRVQSSKQVSSGYTVTLVIDRTVGLPQTVATGVTKVGSSYYVCTGLRP